MDDKIKQLWEQGTQTISPRDGDFVSVSAENIEEFTALIVKECAGFTDKTLHPFLLKHFGIKGG